MICCFYSHFVIVGNWTFFVSCTSDQTNTMCERWSMPELIGSWSGSSSTIHHLQVELVTSSSIRLSDPVSGLLVTGARPRGAQAQRFFLLLLWRATITSSSWSISRFVCSWSSSLMKLPRFMKNKWFVVMRCLKIVPRTFGGSSRICMCSYHGRLKS